MKVPSDKVKELLLLGVKAKVENSYISGVLRKVFNEDLHSITYKSYYHIQRDLEDKIKARRKRK